MDSQWLRDHGYSTSLVAKYVAAGWLEKPARRVYRRPRGALTWQQVVISLQVVLQLPVSLGGRSALELQGFGHYLSGGLRAVHLYSAEPLPRWLADLEIGVVFRHHNDARLFATETVPRGLTSLDWNLKSGASHSNDPAHGAFRVVGWGPWDWPITVSTPERAILEVLEELPNHESFEQADRLMEGLSNLSPRRLRKLLADCKSIKVKRLFFFFADRHGHQWLRRLPATDFDLGTGNRSLVKGGKLDRRYHITVPEDLDGLA